MQLHVLKCCCDVGFLPVPALLAGSPDMELHVVVKGCLVLR